MQHIHQCVTNIKGLNFSNLNLGFHLNLLTEEFLTGRQKQTCHAVDTVFSKALLSHWADGSISSKEQDMERAQAPCSLFLSGACLVFLTGVGTALALLHLKNMTKQERYTNFVFLLGKCCFLCSCGQSKGKQQDSVCEPGKWDLFFEFVTEIL